MHVFSGLNGSRALSDLAEASDGYLYGIATRGILNESDVFFRFGPIGEGPSFRRGDFTGDGAIDITDPISFIEFQFTGRLLPFCLDALDFDDNEIIGLSDPIANLTYQFLGGDPSAAPGTSCGVDLTDDDGLDCKGPTSCTPD